MKITILHIIGAYDILYYDIKRTSGFPRSFLFAVAIGRGELRSPAGRRGRRPLQNVVSSFEFDW